MFIRSLSRENACRQGVKNVPLKYLKKEQGVPPEGNILSL